jgi:hypothetical protein
MSNNVIKGGDSTTQSSAFCKTCGHPSHCGSNATMLQKDYACDGGLIREVVICSHCNCNKCRKSVTK